MSALRERLKEEVNRIPAIDSHEHVRLGHDNLDELVEQTWDFDRLFVHTSYMGSLHGSVNAMRKPPGDFAEAVRFMRTASTFRAAVEIPLRDLYGYDVSQLKMEDVPALNEQISRNYEKGALPWCREVFRRGNITRAVKVGVSLRYFEEFFPSMPRALKAVEAELFAPILRVDDLIAAEQPWELWTDEGKRDKGVGILPAHKAVQWDLWRKHAERCGAETETLDGYLDLAENVIAFVKERGAVGLKSSLAYVRTLDVADVSLEDARAAYQQRKPCSKVVQDYMWKHVARLAAGYDLPFVIHTGPVGASAILGSNPALLRNLLCHAECKDTRFVLIHTGYPYARELVILAWSSPKVYVDFVWLPLLGFESSVRVMSEFLEWAPMHKFTMGGDAHEPETAYGAMAQNREALTEVLARKVELGVWTEETAIDAAQAVLHDNAVELYRLG